MKLYTVTTIVHVVCQKPCIVATINTSCMTKLKDHVTKLKDHMTKLKDYMTCGGDHMRHTTEGDKAGVCPVKFLLCCVKLCQLFCLRENQVWKTLLPSLHSSSQAVTESGWYGHVQVKQS